jgi:hypothetical protein
MLIDRAADRKANTFFIERELFREPGIKLVLFQYS